MLDSGRVLGYNYYCYGLEARGWGRIVNKILAWPFCQTRERKAVFTFSVCNANLQQIYVVCTLWV